MHGNVLQWCADGFSQDYYRQSPPSDPLDPAAGPFRVLRGAACDFDASFCRSASRYRCAPPPTVTTTSASAWSARLRPKEERTTAAPTTYGPTAPPPAIAPFDATKAKQHQRAWANHLAVPIEQTNSIGMKLALIPPGEFDMGSSDKEIAAEIQQVKRDIGYCSRCLPKAHAIA